MARVVQRRTSPPYLLIVFVFLFVLAAAGAIVSYMQLGDANKKYADESDKLKKALKDKGDLERNLASQSQMLAGQPVPFEESQALDKSVREEVGAAPGESLVQIIRREHADALRQAATVKELRGEIDNLVNEKKTANDSLDKLRKELDAAQTAYKAKAAEFDATLKADRGKHDEALAKARADWDAARADLDAKVKQLDKDVKDRELTISAKDIEISKLRDIISKKGARPEPVVMVPDGRIVRVIEGQGICFIDLTSKDGVRPGLPFEVYSRAGMPSDPNQPGKASIEIRNVADSYSECRIVREDPKDPIVPGDLIANVVFDKNRTYKFVVVGVFDLNNTGKATDEGTREVKDLIRRAGGKLKDDLDYDVDFLVLGERPPQPPAAGDNPQAIAVFDAQMKALEQYDKVKSAAFNMPCFVLNTNRFLALTGYLPKK